MKPSFVAPLRRAAVIAAVAIGAMAYQGEIQAPDTASGVLHPPIRVHRNDDGSVKRGSRNEIATSNWSGYAVAKYQTSQSYTSAFASWTVPNVTFDTKDTSGSTVQYSSTWVGVGGYCEDSACSQVDQSLIQLGTEQDVASNGATRYYSWYELIPKSPVVKRPQRYPVKPGDFIKVSMVCNSPCPKTNQSWTLTMWDYPSQTATVANWSWTANLTYTSSLNSAEWIEEAPWSNGVLPLANFGTAHIFPQPATIVSGLTASQNGIQMLDPWGQTANPSDPNTSLNSASFNDCWGHGSLTACPMP